jgi:uncharacterized membrane protein
MLPLSCLRKFNERRVTRQQGGAGRVVDPNTILKARYARGEITKEQYEQMKKDIG